MKIKIIPILLLFIIQFYLITMVNAYGKTFTKFSFQTDNLFYWVDSVDTKENKIDSIINFGKKYLGNPYRYKISNQKILDCSGFLSFIFEKQGIKLPTSTLSIAKIVEIIPFNEIKKGDLMFFKGRNLKSDKVGHVALVTSINDNMIEMMHSCRRGILLEKYNVNKYYTSRFLFGGRLHQLTSQNLSLSDSSYCNITKYVNVPNDTINKPKDKNIRSVKIIGVGDIMLGTAYPNTGFLPPNDGKFLLSPVKEIISKGNVSFANLEGVLLSGNGPVKKCSDPKVCFVFKMPEHYSDYLLNAGFNLLSIANNHIMDFGTIGSTNTIKVLDEKSIHYAGLKECPYTIFEKDGIKYGFAAFAPNTGTININDYQNLKKIISHLDSLCNIVIVSFHGGAEGSANKHITRNNEIFLGENRGNPYEFARIAIDAGADVIFGHGPHVTRAIDLYKNRFIAYSLGNFATYGSFNLSGLNGISPIIELDIDTKGNFIKGKIYSVKQIGKGGPIIDDKNLALKEIIQLTRSDIPNCPLIITSNGIIEKKEALK